MTIETAQTLLFSWMAESLPDLGDGNPSRILAPCFVTTEMRGLRNS